MNNNQPRLYLWQGYDTHNQPLQGEITATTLLEAKYQLLSQGLLPIKIKSGPKLNARTLNKNALLLITRQLATMLQSGLPLVNSLQLLAREHSNPCWRFILNQIQLNISQGQPFSHTLRVYPDIFPPLYQEVIATGELTGQLDQCCHRLVLQQEQSFQLQKKVQKALRYPLFLLIVSLIVALLMLLFVLPKFAQVYQNFDAELPVFTQIVINLSMLLQEYFLIITGLFIVLYISYKKFLHDKYQYQKHYGLLHLPILGMLIRLHCLTQLFQTLSMTQSAGITLLSGLNAAKKTATNLVYQQAIDQVIQTIKNGVSLSHAIDLTKMFPSICYQLIRVGEESGTLDLMLNKLAHYYQQQTEEITDGLSQKIEPIMMIILGVLIGGLVIAMYLPIFQLGNVIH